MKNLKKVLALVLAVVMIMGTIAVASAKDYSDVKATDNYAEAIDILSNLKILDGFEDGTFKAEGTLTRAQAAKIVAIVHNAATNGKIQSDIADLYANAQNPFVDCNGNWALPYINYCRITGLADGMTATTYAPKREVTGVQFLKLMLTTLNFNTSKEGYTGTGWDINVLNRANEIGLTAGLADGWKAIAPVKRGEAAQILVNALTAYLVEYGTKIKAPTTIDYSPIAAAKAEEAYNTAFRTFKWQEAYDKAYDSVKDKKTMTADEKKEYATNAADEAQFAAAKKAYDEVVAKFGVNGLFDVAFVSKETVNKTGMTLASKMGITVKADNDKFMRPGTRWTYKSWSKFYMDTAKATYNTAVTVCDVLKAFGVAESDPTAITANVYTDGIKGLSNEDSFNAESHKNTARSCKKDTIGCQGVLTQVWKVGTEYRITEIHYFLAQVETVNKATHRNDATTDINVYHSVNDKGYEVTEHKHTEFASRDFTIETNAYAKDAYLVVTVSRIANKAGFEDSYSSDNGAQVVDHAAAEIKTGKLTGAAINVDPTITKIDGTSYKDACQFVKGYDITKADTIWTAPSKNGNTYDFAMDPFGNVIGCIEHTDSKTYVVIDKIWDANAEATGDMLNAAVLVGFDAKPTDKIFVDKLTDWVKAYDDASLNSLLMTAAQKNTRWAGEIFTYTVNKDGNYVLTYTADKFENDAFVSYKKGEAWVDYDVNGSSYGVKINNATKFLVKDVTGEYKAYTGYAGLPALTGSTIDFVVDDNNYAEYVYITGAAYASDKVTGFVINNGAWDNEWVDTKTGINYELKTVYVNGEATTVRLSLAHGDQAAINETGFYTFKTEVDENGVMIYKVDDFRSVGELYTVKSFDKGVLETTDGHAVVLDEIPVYLVEMAGLTVGTTDDLTEKDGRKIYMHYELEKGEYVLKAIYVMLDGIVPDVH